MADLLHYVYSRRGIEVHSEIVCRKHYDEMRADGGFMAPFSVREIAAGLKQTVTPYAGDRPCGCCEEEAGRQKGTAA